MNNLSNGRRAAEKIKYPEEEVVEQSKGKMTVLPSGSEKIGWGRSCHKNMKEQQGQRKGKYIIIC
jgi:hypothetical protein